MATPRRQQQWPAYPNIPIVLEAYDGQGNPKSYDTISPPSPTPPIFHRDRPVHSIAASTITQFTSLSPICPIPEPPPEVMQQQTNRPVLRSFPTSKPRIQLDADTSRAAVESGPDLEIDSEKHRGLGIAHASKPRLETATSPIRKKEESTPTIAERIEQRLWRFTSSENVLKRWLFEIISWSISALCMGAIVVVLLKFRNKRLPKGPLGLNVITFIAILSKIAGAALLLPVSEALGQLKWSWFFQGDSKKMWDFEIFDNASRGPWGSFLLLIRTKAKALAALGALITLFSLALDLFFQQVVGFPERWAAQGNSSIPKVVHYAPHYGTALTSGQVVAQRDQDIQAVAAKFFYDNGTQPIPFGNGSRADIPLSCPSSNCTWEPYDTLGVCSKCADVSKYLAYGCRTATMDWVSNPTKTGELLTFPNGTMCGYFLNSTSDEPTLMSGYHVNTSSTGEALLMRALPLVTNPERDLLFGGSINFKDVRNTIIDVLIVGAANGSDSVYRNQTPEAHECILSWCVKTIKSSYYLANYQEDVVETVFNTSEGPSPWKTSRFESPALNGTDIVYLENVTISEYGISNVTALRTIYVFDDMFPSFLTVANSSADPFLRYQVNPRGKINLRTLENNPWILPNNVTHHMERFATALTNVIRSSTSNEMVSGLANCRETYVSVRWEWLALPLILLLLSLIFLVLTVIKTSREREHVGVWKTSVIATLLYGLPDDMQKKITASTKPGTPRAKAKQLKVKFHPIKGWRASGNLSSPMTPNIKRNQPPPGWI